MGAMNWARFASDTERVRDQMQALDGDFYDLEDVPSSFERRKVKAARRALNRAEFLLLDAIILAEKRQ